MAEDIPPGIKDGSRKFRIIKSDSNDKVEGITLVTPIDNAIIADAERPSELELLNPDEQIYPANGELKGHVEKNAWRLANAINILLNGGQTEGGVNEEDKTVEEIYKYLMRPCLTLTADDRIALPGRYIAIVAEHFMREELAKSKSYTIPSNRITVMEAITMARAGDNLAGTLNPIDRMSYELSLARYAYTLCLIENPNTSIGIKDNLEARLMRSVGRKFEQAKTPLPEAWKMQHSLYRGTDEDEDIPGSGGAADPLFIKKLQELSNQTRNNLRNLKQDLERALARQDSNINAIKARVHSATMSLLTSEGRLIYFRATEPREFVELINNQLSKVTPRQLVKEMLGGSPELYNQT